MLANLTCTHPVFGVYVSDARAATRDGARNRTAMLGLNGTGAALGIVFERMEVRTIIGRLAATEELAIADLPHAGELHVDHPAARRIRDRLGRRVVDAHDVGATRRTVREAQLQPARARNNVGVGQDVTVGREDDTGAAPCGTASGGSRDADDGRPDPLDHADDSS